MARNVQIKARIDGIATVLRDDQLEHDGVSTVERLMRELGLASAPCVAGAYLDLLTAA